MLRESIGGAYNGRMRRMKRLVGGGGGENNRDNDTKMVMNVINRVVMVSC